VLDRDAPRYDDAVFEFERVRTGDYSLLVSRNVLLEIIKVLIDGAMKQPEIRQGPSAAKIAKFVKSSFESVANRLLSIPNLRIFDPDVSIERFLQHAYDLGLEVFGSAHSDKTCPVCKGRYDYFEYDGPQQMDFFHALLARDMGCEMFLTFDRGFQLLKGDQRFKPLRIEVLRHGQRVAL
jgi:predicted nucleic acid-binding protein